MRAHTGCISQCLPVDGGVCRPFAASRSLACRILCLSSVVLTMLLLLPGLAAPADQSAVQSDESMDARWLPWIGSWRLISEAVKEDGGSANEDYLVDIRPGEDRKSIIMKSFRDEALLLETRIAADGSRQPLQDNRCSGWYTYSWSDSGKRLLFQSQSGCPAELPRFISGISIVTDNRDWFDIQLMRSGDDVAVSVRKYRSVREYPNAGPGSTEAPRFAAGTSLSVDEIIELSRKVPSELLETAVLELQKPFRINSSTLKRLSDAGVQPQLVDLMVALSFPDKFSVNRRRITAVGREPSAASDIFYGPPSVWLPFGYWSIYGPYSNWYWGTPIYGYWGPGWYVWPGGYPDGDHDGHGDNGGGRLVNGRGYSRVEPYRSNSQPRYAQPREHSGGSAGRVYQNSTDSSSSPSSHSTGSSSGSSSGSSQSSGGSSPSASPGGYHSGGGGSGGQAKPRD